MDKPNLIFTDSIQEAFKSYCELNNITKSVFLCDSNTKELCLPLLGITNSLVLSIDAGEQHKDIESFSKIIDGLTSLGADRQTVLFNLGGGVITDIGGFSASVYRRGIPFVHIPTTLLAMCDAAIGGKTAIDHGNFKNYIGTFNQPESVLISTEFLKTLPDAQIESAWAEIIKIASVYSEKLFRLIDNDAAINIIINECVALKQEIVQQDFKDEHIRQLLNFGHTIGHAYESYRLELGQPILHGYAVAKGMLMELDIASNLDLINIENKQQIEALIRKKIQVEPITEEEFESLFKFILADKKNTNNSVTFSLPTGIGIARFGIKLTVDELKILKNQRYM